MAMAPKVSIDKTFIAPETLKYQRHKYDKIKEQQGQSSQQQQYLQVPQQSSSSYDYCNNYQDCSAYQQNASSSKQQSASSSPSITLSSPKLTFGESLRESLRDLYVPKFLSNLRKSASEISLVLEAVRSGPTSTDLQAHGVSLTPATKKPVVGDNTSKSIRGPTVKKRKRRNALVAWHNYSPHHLNKQIRYGN